jgi:hypothetical protein
MGEAKRAFGERGERGVDLPHPRGRFGDDDDVTVVMGGGVDAVRHCLFRARASTSSPPPLFSSSFSS